MANGVDGLTTIAQKTDNDILLLVIVLAIVLLILSIPLYKIMMRANEKKRQQEIDREEHIIQVIKENTQVNAGLKTLLETTNANCDLCRKEQLERLDKVHNRIDSNGNQLTEILTLLKQSN